GSATDEIVADLPPALELSNVDIDTGGGPDTVYLNQDDHSDPATYVWTASIAGGEGDDAIFTGPEEDAAWGDFGDLDYRPTPPPGSYDDVISSRGGEDVVNAQWGNNLATGGGDGDSVVAYSGSNVLVGGAGVDGLSVLGGRAVLVSQELTGPQEYD